MMTGLEASPRYGTVLAIGIILAATFVWLGACDAGNATGPDAGDGGLVDAAGDAALDGSGDADHDGDAAPERGPVTLVMRGGAVVTDRLCDHDGDGDLDNAMADLGASSAAVWAMLFSTAIDGFVRHDVRLMLHIPMVDDLAGPTDSDPVALHLDAEDIDVPPDPSDDFSGTEPFFVQGDSVDGCGEPLDRYTEATLEGGRFSGRIARMEANMEGVRLVTRDLRFMGTIEPGGTSALLMSCSVSTVADLGRSPGTSSTSDLTLLEETLAGGAHVGLPTLLPLVPDLDLDGDGLERFVVDDDGHLAQCIDGDRTVVEGRDCWQDERFADGISMVMENDFVSAIFAGLEPTWRETAVGDCPDGPPVESLFDPR